MHLFGVVCCCCRCCCCCPPACAATHCAQACQSYHCAWSHSSPAPRDLRPVLPLPFALPPFQSLPSPFAPHAFGRHPAPFPLPLFSYCFILSAASGFSGNGQSFAGWSPSQFEHFIGGLIPPLPNALSPVYGFCPLHGGHYHGVGCCVGCCCCACVDVPR